MILTEYLTNANDTSNIQKDTVEVFYQNCLKKRQIKLSLCLWNSYIMVSLTLAILRSFGFLKQYAFIIFRLLLKCGITLKLNYSGNVFKSFTTNVSFCKVYSGGTCTYLVLITGQNLVAGEEWSGGLVISFVIRFFCLPHQSLFPTIQVWNNHSRLFRCLLVRHSSVNPYNKGTWHGRAGIPYFRIVWFKCNTTFEKNSEAMKGYCFRKHKESNIASVKLTITHEFHKHNESLSLSDVSFALVTQLRSSWL